MALLLQRIVITILFYKREMEYGIYRIEFKFDFNKIYNALNEI